MNVAVAKTGTERRLSDVFALARGRLPGDGRVAEVRQAAIEVYERLGLPHRRVEEWKYTDLRALMREVLPLAPLPDAAMLLRAREALASIAMAGAQKLVLVDGAVVPELSDLGASAPDVTIRTLREILDDAANAARADLLLTETSDAMVSLNAAMATDGVVISIADGAHPDCPYCGGIGRLRLYAIACQGRQRRARDAGRELRRGGWGAGLSGA